MSMVGRNNHLQKTGSKIFGRKLKRLADFSKIGGLSHHIKLLREIIIFPLLYSDLYAHFNIKAPRGVLFYGPPGTGKTLVAGALAAEVNKECFGKVSFYQRKGADILDKWVGESERKLRELFEEAARTSPSVIFFDELDGLAPERSQKNDQVHCSVVATLLALMDGLDSMPGVIVIGATNRVDAIDPALRRPGRFDKELYFPLPSAQARTEILQILMSSWRHNINSEFLTYLSELTTGYSGSDLSALCAETVLCCMKRIYPEIQTASGRINRKIKIEPHSLQVLESDFLNAKLNIVPSAHRMGNKMRKLSFFIQPLLSRQLNNILQKLQLLWPHFIDPETRYLLGHERYAGRLLLVGTNLQGLNTHLVPALLHALEHLPAHVLDIPALFEKNINNVRHNIPSVLVLSRIDEWWDLLDNSTQVGVTAGLEDLHASLPVLIIATCNKNLPEMLQKYFYNNSSLVVNIEDPTIEEKEEFLAPLFFAQNKTSVLKILFERNTLKTLSIKDVKKEKDEHNSELQTTNRYYLRSGASDYKKPNLKRKHVDRMIDVIPPKKTHSLNVAKCDFDKNTSLTKKCTDELENMQESTIVEKIPDEKDHFTTVLTSLINNKDTNRCLVNYKNNFDNSCNKNTIFRGCGKWEPSTSIHQTNLKKAFYAYGDSQDVDQVKIFKLWKKAAHNTSKNLSVGLLELLYDTITVCIHIYKSDFDCLVEHLDKALDNFEMSHHK